MYEDYYSFIYSRRSSGVSHHSPEKIIELFHRAADEPQSLKEVTQFFLGELDGELGTLNDNDLKNIRYTIIGCCYFLCRFLIERHVDPELAYNSTDYFIGKADETRSLQEARELFDMMGELSVSLIRESNRPSYGYLTDRAIHYIEQKLYTPLTARQVASFMGVTPEYLSQVFKRDTGRTLYRYIQECKMREAQGMLRYSGRSITEIAQTLGYSSAAHFSSAFLHIVGCTPSCYRDTALV
jgi:AraC-like DNA-binding protein